jgi:hypothetical protein
VEVPQQSGGVTLMIAFVLSPTKIINVMIEELVDKQVMELKKLWANKR